jgi:phosphomannomutase
VSDPSTVASIFARLRAGGRYSAVLPSARGGFAITGVRDLTATADRPGGYDSSQPGGHPALPVSAGTNMITFTLAGGAEVTLRTSGTEPKLKWYAEIESAGDAVADAEDRALPEGV